MLLQTLSREEGYSKILHSQLQGKGIQANSPVDIAEICAHISILCQYHLPQEHRALFEPDTPYSTSSQEHSYAPTPKTLLTSRNGNTKRTNSILSKSLRFKVLFLDILVVQRIKKGLEDITLPPQASPGSRRAICKWNRRPTRFS